MYLIIRVGITCLCTILLNTVLAQKESVNHQTLEIGFHFAGEETIFYGASGKFLWPLSQRKHYPVLGVSISTHFDVKGESEREAYLKNDVDMRIIPAVQIGYSLNFNRWQLILEVPAGTSIAITRGILVNERVGFERTYANTEFLWHYGLSFSPKYRINKANQIGMYSFLPLASDKAISGYLLGIGWTKKIINRK